MPIYLQKLQHYVELITFWQTKFNLVSKNSVNSIWERHILDSLQLLKFITPLATIPTPTTSSITTNSSSSANLSTVESGNLLNNPKPLTSPKTTFTTANKLVKPMKLNPPPKPTLANNLPIESAKPLTENSKLPTQTPPANSNSANSSFTKQQGVAPSSSTATTNVANPSVVSGKIIFDLGSGAGFPSVVLAIMDSQNTYYAIESNNKKCVFLQYVKRELKLDNFIVVNTRIENFILQPQVSPPVATQNYQALTMNESKVASHHLKAHIVISRALTGLQELLQYTEALLLPKGYGIFPKGASWQQELNSLSTQQQKLFTITPYNNLFSTGGKVIICQAKQ